MRFLKLDSAGARISAEASEWSAVEDTQMGLIWSVEEFKPMTWKQAVKFPGTLDLCGFKDWRLPTRFELISLVDLSRHSPAIDVTYFPKCQSDLYWSSDPLAASPGDFAWLVGFSSGFSGWGNQGSEGLVRAVRPRQ